MGEPALFAECVQKLLQEFKAYDTAVDLVSCWEFFFTQASPLSASVHYFDRFPRLDPREPEEKPKTPDFAVLMSPSYGLIGEIKAGFPIEQTSFVGHLEKLKKYDRPLGFKAGAHGNFVVPADHDILLIIPLRDAHEIVTRVEGLLRDGTVRFERSLVVFEWYYDDLRDEFVFRKVLGQSSDFRDSSLAEDVRLSAHFTQRARSLKITPDKMQEIKAGWQFCNDAPPAIYTLVFLWTKVFYHLLDPAQREQWRRRNPQKELPIDVTISRLTKEVERMYPLEWGHWTDWCRDALDALAACGLARKVGADRYVVGYRNITRELGEPGHGARGSPRPSNLARSLATYICRVAQAPTGGTPSGSTGPSEGRLFPG